LTTISPSSAAAATTPPVKEKPTSHYGWEVNKTKDKTPGATQAEKNLCTIESHNECQLGRVSSGAGGFAFPNGVAAAPDGSIYVSDTNNQRIQELTPTGTFINMFGWEVNQTKDNTPGATQTEKNLCTAASGDTCKQGVEGSLGGQIAFGFSIAVDQTTGNVFVEDSRNWRVDEYTAAGAFVLTLGSEVDKTTKSNVCTAASSDLCGLGVENTPESTKLSAFKFSPYNANLLAVGGPEDLLYVGDEHRVQEFDPATGEWKGEISLAPISSEPGNTVVALALDNSCVLHEPVLSEPTCKELDPEYGDLYLVYRIEGETGARATENVVRKFIPGIPTATEVNDGHFPLTLAPKESNAKVEIKALAAGPSGRIAATWFEHGPSSLGIFGDLVDGHAGRLITSFSSFDEGGLTFSRKDELYATLLTSQEVLAYKPVPVAELLTSVVSCSQTGEVETSVVFNCELNGEVDPWGVKETEVWFESGKTPHLGEQTPRLPVEAKGSEGEEELPLVKVDAPIAGLRPNQIFYYRVTGYDKNVEPPETPLTSDIGSFVTTFVAPKIVGPANAAFVKPNSAVLSGESNPENATTEYFFEYAEQALCVQGVRSGEACPGVATTPVLESGAYAKAGVTQEASGLHPGTLYHYRLFAESEDATKTKHLRAIGPEAEFTTAPPAKVQALTGGYSGVTATSALISGSGNPDGQAATYAFELGVYAGATTQYGTVFSGPVPVETSFVAEQLLTGLQPGTEYAYRIKVTSGYGTALGATATFTTEGLHAALPLPPPLAMLPPPLVPFPKPIPICRHGYQHDSHSKCVKIKTRRRPRAITKHAQRKRRNSQRRLREA
jgi:hypothetical protein